MKLNGHRVAVAQIGARRHYAVPCALYRSGMLEVLFTDACANISPWSWMKTLMPGIGAPGALHSLLNRIVPEIPESKIVGFPLFAATSILGRRIGETQTELWARRNSTFCANVVKAGFGDANAIYAFNGAALELFDSAREKGLRTILDQTAAPWRWNTRMLAEESEKWPGWEECPAEMDVSSALIDREEEEWGLADLIICGSSFCRDKLLEAGVQKRQCRVLEYPRESRKGGVDSDKDKNRRMVRVLFVGTLQLRKGIQYLYGAMNRLRDENIEARIVGPSLLTESANKKLDKVCFRTGTVPRSKMIEHYNWADIFVLPTLSEGSANVCYEAMAAGLPLITTAAAGSMVEHQHNGMLVEEKSVDTLVDAIRFLALDSETRRRYGEAAQETAKRVQDIESYASQFVDFLEDSDSAMQ